MIRGSLSAFGASALVVACLWILLCFVVLVVLIPIASGQGLAIRSFIVLAPLGFLWLLAASGRGSIAALMTLWVIMLGVSDLSLRQRDLSDTSLDPQNLVKMAVWGLGLLVALLNWGHLRAALRQPPVMLFTAFALWSIVTAAYSPIRAYSFGASIALLSVLVFGAVVRRAVPDSILLKASIVALGALLYVSLALFLLAPDRAMAPMEGGSIMRLAAPFGTPNSLGRVSALVLLLCTISVTTGVLRWRSPLLIAGGLAATACLLLSQSRTAMVALIAALGIILALARPMRVLAAAIVVTSGILVFVLLDFDVRDVASAVSRTGRATEVMTLTGRTRIWDFYWSRIIEAPFLGYGYASSKYWMPLLFQTHWGWTTTHAHNLWIQVWFSTGLIGVVLLASIVIAQFKYWLETRDAASLGLLALVVVLGLAETGFLAVGAPNIVTIAWCAWLAGRDAGNDVIPTRTIAVFK